MSSKAKVRVAIAAIALLAPLVQTGAQQGGGAMGGMGMGGPGGGFPSFALEDQRVEPSGFLIISTTSA